MMMIYLQISGTAVATKMSSLLLTTKIENLDILTIVCKHVTKKYLFFSLYTSELKGYGAFLQKQSNGE